MKFAETIIRIADAMACARRASKQCGGATAMQVVCDIVARGAKLTYDSETGSRAAAFDRDDARHVRVAIEQRRDPVFEQEINLRTRKKTSERVKRRRGEHRIANGAQAHDEHAAHPAPIPTRRGERLRLTFKRARARRL